MSKSGFDASGDDCSFLLIQCDAEISRGRLVDLAKKAGLTAITLSSKRATSSSAPSIHLMEVEDHVAKGDKRIDEFLKALDDSGANIIPVGGYPTPPTYTKTVQVLDAPKAAQA